MLKSLSLMAIVTVACFGLSAVAGPTGSDAIANAPSCCCGDKCACDDCGCSEAE